MPAVSFERSRKRGRRQLIGTSRESCSERLRKGETVFEPGNRGFDHRLRRNRANLTLKGRLERIEATPDTDSARYPSDETGFRAIGAEEVESPEC